jgi:RNA polymerase sigma-70 factor (ECF subfamily)
VTADPEPLAFPTPPPTAPTPAGDSVEQGLERAEAQAAAGDPDAFEAVYREHVGRVFAVCLRMAGDRREAEELTQDVFVRAWEKLPGFRGESALGTWLHRLAVNVVLEKARGDLRRTRRVETTGDVAALATPALGGSPEDRMDIEQAIAALPPGARSVFVLHEIEGYRHDEIAQLTGTAVGTLRAQLHRARQLLMEALGR